MKELSDETLKSSLEDAGFDETEIKEFLCLKEQKKKHLQCECLDKKREKLLNRIHEREKQITCIDYLKYILEKEN